MQEPKYKQGDILYGNTPYGGNILVVRLIEWGQDCWAYYGEIKRQSNDLKLVLDADCMLEADAKRSSISDVLNVCGAVAKSIRIVPGRDTSKPNTYRIEAMIELGTDLNQLLTAIPNCISITPFAVGWIAIDVSRLD
jgi:hypothetical protein